VLCSPRRKKHAESISDLKSSDRSFSVELVGSSNDQKEIVDNAELRDRYPKRVWGYVHHGRKLSGRRREPRRRLKNTTERRNVDRTRRKRDKTVFFRPPREMFRIVIVVVPPKKNMRSKRTHMTCTHDFKLVACPAYVDPGAYSNAQTIAAKRTTSIPVAACDIVQ